MEKELRIGKLSAVISLLSGTIIFIVYFISSWADLLIVGYISILIAGLINMVILIDLILKSKNHRVNKVKLFKTSGLILLNIPVMLFYLVQVQLL